MTVPFDSYETVIGFECHVQLNTRSKLFSPGANKFGQHPNSLVNIVDIGLPGVLPSLNQQAVNCAIKLGLALKCDIREKSVFSRKHYFYPDLPKGYQISQFDLPICEGGTLTYFVNNKEKKLAITRIHIEEDAGKNTHVDGINASFVDFNRAGTPLLEVVSEPDLRTPEDAIAAFKSLRQLVTFLGICDGNMQEGSLRADINVSVRKIGDKLGTRTETKNLNSFRFLGQAINFEARRQVLELEAGNKINQETRLWDPNKKESRSMRSKEEAHDYRYFPDPDLLPLVIPANQINKIKQNLQELPHDKLYRYQEKLGLNYYDAEILTSSKEISGYFEEALNNHNNPKSLANWIINEVSRHSKDTTNDDEIANFSPQVSPKILAELVSLIDQNTVSSTIAKKVYLLLVKHPEKNPGQIIQENNWQVLNSSSAIQDLVAQVIKENPEEVVKFKSGKTKVFGFLMGQLMKKSKGKADPKLATELLTKELKK